MDDNFVNFVIQAIANLAGTILGGAILFFLFEKRVADLQEKSNTKKLLNNLLSEVMYDYIVAERILSNAETSLTTSKFPVAKFRTQGLLDFISGYPIPDDENRFYLTLKGLIGNMEAVNYLIDQVFRSQDARAVIENKKEIINKATGILAQINQVLSLMAAYNKLYNFQKE